MTDARSEVRRKPDRGSTDPGQVEGILDAALVCHVGFVVDDQPYVIPMTFARDGDTLLLHGSPASRMLRRFDGTAEACVEVTILDGLVLARSAFNSSMNYRSLMVFGTALAVTDEAAYRPALGKLGNSCKSCHQDYRRPKQ